MSRIVAYLQGLYLKYPMGFALVCLLLLTIPVSIFFGSNVRKIQKFDTVSQRIQENKSLIINEITPSGIVSQPKRITFTFSDPVEIHIFEHYFSISPATEGIVVKGDHPNQLVFIPHKPFEQGTMYSLRVVNGLTSQNGKVLVDDHFHDFSAELAIVPQVSQAVKQEATRVSFMKDEIAAKVLSFPASKPISFQVKISGAAKTTLVKLYKSDQANLLNYLVYTKDKARGSDDFYSYGDTFLRNSISHNSNNVIDSFALGDKQEKQLQLEPGVYYAEANLDSVIGSAFFIVNSIGVTFRQDDKKILFSTFDLETGRKVSHSSNLGLYNLENYPQQLTTLSYNELETNVPFSFEKRLDAVVGTVNGESVFIPVRLPQSFADIQTTQNLDQAKEIFLYTDRPLYKPQDRVFFRGIVKVDGDAIYRVPPEGLPIRVFLGYDKKPEIDMRVQTDANGIFSGSFELPESINGIGEYNYQALYASTSLENGSYYSPGNGSASFEVRKYVKPEFELKTTVNNVEMIRNDKAVFTVSGNYFNGDPIKNQEISYELYEDTYFETERTVYNKNFNITAQGGMCGGGRGEEYYGNLIGVAKKAQLDEYGRVQITYTLPESNIGSKKLTLVAKKKDKVGNEIISAVNTLVHGAKFNIFFMPSAQTYSPNDEVVAPFYAETLTGEKLTNKELTYRFIETSYDRTTYKTVEKTLTTGTVKTNDDGRGIVTFQLPINTSTNSTYLVLEAKDDAGNITDARKYMSIRTKDENTKYSFWERSNVDQTYLTITSSQNNFKVGDTIKLTVKSPKDLDVLMSLERGRIYYPRLISLNKGDNTVEITVGEDLSPSITVIFSFFADGSYHTEGLSLNVPAMHKLLQVLVSTDKERYKPTEHALVKIRTKDADNAPVPANLSLSVVDKALLTLRKNTSPPIHSAFYYFRPRSTNASSSLTWVGQYGGGGGGGGGGGPSLGGQAVDTLYWNPNVTTGVDGETVLSVPLEGFKTTWKALVIGSTEDAQFGQGDAEFIVAD